MTSAYLIGLEDDVFFFPTWFLFDLCSLPQFCHQTFPYMKHIVTKCHVLAEQYVHPFMLTHELLEMIPGQLSAIPNRWCWALQWCWAKFVLKICSKKKKKKSVLAIFVIFMKILSSPNIKILFFILVAFKISERDFFF